MSKIDIVGFTLAEIALVILFAVLVLFLPQKERQENEVQTLRQKIKRLEESESTLKQRIASLEKERQQFQSPRPDLRSKAIPTCFEIDKTDWLFSVTIRGKDVFEIAGKDMSLTDLLKSYDAQMKSAKAKGCIHRVEVFYDPEISIAEYDTGLRRLEAWFSTAKRGHSP
jgi:cell division septum initiation protein DivIVA